MKYNSDFGKIVDGELVLAPHQIVTETRAIPCPTAEQYAEYHYLQIIRTTTRVASAGHELVRVGWEERSGQIYAVYEERELPPVVRTFTPIALKRCLKIVGAWTSVKNMMDAAGADVYDDYIMAIELKENDPQFSPYLAAARQRYGADFVDRIIDAAAQGTEYVNTLTAADLTGGAE